MHFLSAQDSHEEDFSVHGLPMQIEHNSPSSFLGALLSVYPLTNRATSRLQHSSKIETLRRELFWLELFDLHFSFEQLEYLDQRSSDCLHCCCSYSLSWNSILVMERSNYSRSGYCKQNQVWYLSFCVRSSGSIGLKWLLLLLHCGYFEYLEFLLMNCLNIAIS